MEKLGGLILALFLFSCSSKREIKPPENDLFISVEAGYYELGIENHPINPKRNVFIKAFEISKYECTNADFKEFVDETKYLTDAERFKNAMTFFTGLDEYEWKRDSTANWRYPNGTEKGGIGDKMDHPVSCISYNDALNYCEWAGVRLPTLDEWEVACRANSSGLYFFNEQEADIHSYANIWKSRTHQEEDIKEDYFYTSPVGAFKPNPWGLYDVYGNVFEFCSDKSSNMELSVTQVNARGGSWWCSESSCNFFNSVDIGMVNKRASFSNHGFRVVKLP
jgi:sulfatase modifying factor 1